MSIQVSLIISTYGRYDEVELLLESLKKQDCGFDIFEAIIIDQNDVIDLTPLVKKYENKFNLIHYKADFKGLSKSKNKGIDMAKGQILTFPDDDCTFYEDTISKALQFFAVNPDAEVVYGSVFDRITNKNVMRNWSKESKKLNVYNFSLRYSAITCFTKMKTKFDENLGVGSKISSGEELDYIIRVLESKEVYYFPHIQVWHPELSVSTMSNEKIRNYAYGYGYAMRKNLNFGVLIIFLFSLSYRIAMLLLKLFSKERLQNYLAVKGRFEGFLKMEY